MRKEDIPVLFEDSACVVVDKPAGLTVHPAGTLPKEERTLVEILAEGEHSPLLLVHRLDKGTTGCLLLAKSEKFCEQLQQQFKNHTVKKAYLALCAGIPEKQKARIDAPIGRNLTQRTKMSLCRTRSSRSAITIYAVLDETKESSLLRCEIETGRTHQIRVHLSSIGHPIVGDMKYGSEVSKRLSEKYGIKSPLLHAHMLEFSSPETGESVRVKAPLPESFIDAARKLGIELRL